MVDAPKPPPPPQADPDGPRFKWTVDVGQYFFAGGAHRVNWGDKGMTDAAPHTLKDCVPLSSSEQLAASNAARRASALGATAVRRLSSIGRRPLDREESSGLLRDDSAMQAEGAATVPPATIVDDEEVEEWVEIEEDVAWGSAAHACCPCCCCCCRTPDKAHEAPHQEAGAKLQAPSPPRPVELPPGWEAFEDDYGQPYFFNEATGVSSWEPPNMPASAQC